MSTCSVPCGSTAGSIGSTAFAAMVENPTTKAMIVFTFIVFTVILSPVPFGSCHYLCGQFFEGQFLYAASVPKC
jgi:hypothetical protein